MPSPIQKTNYKIVKEDTLTVYQDGKVVSKGFTREEDALHSIWVINGSKPDDFYVVDKDGLIACVNRGML